GRQSRECQRQVILFLVCACVCQSGAEPLRYSLAKEMERDSFATSIAEDLGPSASQLTARKTRVVSKGNELFFRLSRNMRVLTAKQWLDREEVCLQGDTCT
ncbi:PCDB1 protein, partial [Crotophaga sulcirostris]|nr:PCDB1 protein [Crotophaga sulcirostris]